MLTKKKIKIYKKYNGNIESWERSNRNSRKKLIQESDWFLIDGFIQDIVLIENGLASDRYRSDVISKLSEACDSQETISQIEALADTARKNS